MAKKLPKNNNNNSDNQDPEYEDAFLKGKNKPKQKTAKREVNNAEIVCVNDNYGHQYEKWLYSDEILPKLEALCAKGLNNTELAKGLGIAPRTFYTWLNKYPQFLFSIYKYRGVNDIFVENALYRSAVGYSYIEEQVSPIGTVVQVSKFMPGNVSAQKFYLTNRMQERYQNKVEKTLKVGENVGALAVVIRRREE